jgi:hypothetical protein
MPPNGQTVDQFGPYPSLSLVRLLALVGCAIKIVQVGVSQVVYSESYGMDDLTAEVFRKAGIELRQHATPSLKLE